MYLYRISMDKWLSTKQHSGRLQLDRKKATNKNLFLLVKIGMIYSSINIKMDQKSNIVNEAQTKSGRKYLALIPKIF